jgi:integrase/recombinase XerD
MKAPIKDNSEIAQLLLQAEGMERPRMYRLMVLLSFRMGLRPMEIAQLDTAWFRGNELRLPLGSSKRKSGRSIVVPAEVTEALQAHMGNRTGTLFLNQREQPFSAQGISDAMRRLYREAGVDGSCYSGRRTLATNMVDAGVSMFIIRDVLGHAHVNTTQEYISSTPNMMRRAMESAYA